MCTYSWALNVFLAVNGIVQYHTGVGFGNATMKLDRIYGTGIFSDPNDLGMTFVMSIPLFLFVLGRNGSSLVFRAVSLVGLCVVLLALDYTNSRGAVVGTAAAMVCLSFMRYKTAAATIAAAALLGVIVVAAPSRGTDIDAGEESAQSRVQSWAEGWNMLKSQPLTGVGFDQYPRASHQGRAQLVRRNLRRAGTDWGLHLCRNVLLVLQRAEHHAD